MALASHWLEDFAAGKLTAKRMTNVAPLILSEANYTPLVVSESWPK